MPKDSTHRNPRTKKPALDASADCKTATGFDHNSQQTQEKKNGCFSEAEVFENELELLEDRRNKVGLHYAAGKKEGSEVLEKSLVGLALSGGGLRSGAYGLGILQGLWAKGLLPAIDYLSTVSGGGYAGAFLSSQGLNSEQVGVDDKPSKNASKGFAIAPGKGGRHSTRMARFVCGGNYLFNSTGKFLNRHTIGLLLIWTLCISALCAVAAILAYCYRLLDYDICRVWLEALGADGEVKLAFFPTFVLMGLWVFLWSCSFVVGRRRATGYYAKYAFYALLISVAVAIAVLLGSGDVYMATAGDLFGLVPNKSEDVITWVHRLMLLLVPVILAALLPYVNPKKLLKSGTSPNASTAEKYTFRFATRALVYGVPFLFVSYFAQENISGWDEKRDDRLQRLEITSRGWAVDSPLWRTLWNESPKNYNRPIRHQFSGFLWSNQANVDPMTLNEIRVALILRQQAVDQKKLVEITDLNDDQLKKIKVVGNGVADTNPGSTGDTQEESNLATSLSIIKERVENKMNSKAQESTLAARGQLRDVRLNLFKRWACFFSYLFDASDRKGKSRENNSVVIHKSSLLKSIRAKEFVIDTLNVQLGHESFCRNFLPDEKLQLFYIASFSKLTPFSKARTLKNPIWPPDKKPESNNFSGDSKQAEGSPQKETLVPPPKKKGGERALATEDFETSYTKLLREFVMIYGPQFSSQEKTIAKDAGHELNDEFHLWVNRVLRAYAKARLAAQSKEYQDMPGLEAVAFSPRSESVREERLHEKVLSSNRALLKAYYGDLVRGKHDKLHSYVVLEEDQKRRWNWFVCSSVICLITGLCVSLNAISWHSFYSRQIADMWIEPLEGLGRDIPLAQVDSHKSGWPYHLINGTVHTIDPLGRNNSEEQPEDFQQEDFLLSYRYCGSERYGYAATADYMKGRVLLDDAVAISGGAVSPVSNRNPLVLVLLFLGNVRLGQWLDHPALSNWSMPNWLRKCRERWPVTPMRILVNLWKKPTERPFCFVTDGGHCENLGVAPLLKRRCKLIISCDAGQDRQYEFFDLAKLVRWARTHEGITITPLKSEKDGSSLDPFGNLIGSKWPGHLKQRESSGNLKNSPLVQNHGFVAEINYPATSNLPATQGYFIYLKASVSGDESLDVLEYYRRNPSFPHEATSDQLFEADRFESYRALGEHTINSVFTSESMSVENYRGLLSSPVDAYIDHLVAGMKRHTQETTQERGARVQKNSEPEKIHEDVPADCDDSAS